MGCGAPSNCCGWSRNSSVCAWTAAIRRGNTCRVCKDLLKRTVALELVDPVVALLIMHLIKLGRDVRFAAQRFVHPVGHPALVGGDVRDDVFDGPLPCRPWL